MRRPGVATTMSVPAASWRVWRSRSVPPYTASTRRSTVTASVSSTSATCTASSRVGTSTREVGADGPARGVRMSIGRPTEGLSRAGLCLAADVAALEGVVDGQCLDRKWPPYALGFQRLDQFRRYAEISKCRPDLRSVVMYFLAVSSRLLAITPRHGHSASAIMVAMTKLAAGDIAPLFSLFDQDGHMVSLADYKGRRVVVYFYPADDTPGCTKEACQFSDLVDDYAALGVEVLGISPDGGSKHQRFRAK